MLAVVFNFFRLSAAEQAAQKAASGTTAGAAIIVGTARAGTAASGVSVIIVIFFDLEAKPGASGFAFWVSGGELQIELTIVVLAWGAAKGAGLGVETQPLG